GLRPGTRLLLQQAAQRRAAHDLATRVPLGAEERRFQLEAKPKTKRHASWQARESSTQLTPWTFIPAGAHPHRVQARRAEQDRRPCRRVSRSAAAFDSLEASRPDRTKR